MKRFSYISLALAALLTAFSCSKENPGTDGNEEPEVVFDETVDASLEINRQTFDATCKETSFQLRITSDYLWRIVMPEDCDWVIPEALSGSEGTTKVKIIITANNTPEERTARLTVQSGKKKLRLNISQSRLEKVLSESEVDTDRIYIPQELRSNDFYKSSSQWYYGRSRQSDHFIVFWEKGDQWDEYGDLTPKDCTNEKLQVDVDDLLEKAELFYKMNIDILNFAVTGKGESNLDKYKMIIMLLYTTDWVATGSGYDNTIGALWVNPSTCHPVGSTIAHEIGHSFQYQVYSDQLKTGTGSGLGSGFRYEIGQGTGFWEQCAQWQSYQKFSSGEDYTNQMFDSYNFTVFKDQCHTHFLHEHQRYASYFLQWYWTLKHGNDAVGRVWRESKKPQDPCEAYMKIYGITNDEFNAEIYDYAARCCTWDYPVAIENTKTIKDYGANYIDAISWKYVKEDGWYRVAKEKCPEATGFNHIRLSVPSGGGPVGVDFVGLPGADGYNPMDGNISKAGWTYGFVTLKGDGSVEYSKPVLVNSSDYMVSSQYDVPSDAAKLWMVVAATPTEYLTHLWDENDDNDLQWPYKVRFSNTNPR